MANGNDRIFIATWHTKETASSIRKEESAGSGNENKNRRLMPNRRRRATGITILFGHIRYDLVHQA